MKHCIIDGERCTKCCQAIGLHVTLNEIRRRDIENGFIKDNWIQISRRTAIRINPLLRKFKAKSFWKCKKLTQNGCGVYEARPRVCSQYPFYGLSIPDWISTRTQEPDYNERCTYWLITSDKEDI